MPPNDTNVNGDSGDGGMAPERQGIVIELLKRMDPEKEKKEKERDGAGLQPLGGFLGRWSYGFAIGWYEVAPLALGCASRNARHPYLAAHTRVGSTKTP